MSSAVGEAFQNIVMVGKFPFAVLMVNINAKFVDVNVHPTKMQVRFSDDKKIYQAIYWAVKNALSQKKYVPSITQRSAKGQSEPVRTFSDLSKNETQKAKQIDINLLRDTAYKPDKLPEKEIKETPNENKTIDEHIIAGLFFGKDKLSSLSSSKEFLSENVYEKKAEEVKIQIKEETKPEEPQKEEPALLTELKAGVDFAIVGQVFATYIILQKDDQMLIIDQHAAQERIFFDELICEYNKKELASQLLLLPATVTVSAELFDAVSANLELFSSLGFECERFGETDFVIRAVPAACSDADTEDLFISVANILKNGCADVKKSFAQDALHTMACKKAIKGNRVLTKDEMENLCEKVLSLESINTCPHGRPICISMTKYEMEKQFKRIV